MSNVEESTLALPSETPICVGVPFEATARPAGRDA
jgi:hypothetical protein